jgi:uncharacterized membrane protein
MQSLEMDGSAKRWLTILLAIVLMIGMFFRISNLDMKPIWVGESETLSLISGYSESEAINKIATIGADEDSIVNISSFLKYRYPNSEKNLGDILQKLHASGRAPLYFLLARYWVELFGHSVATLRSLSVVLSLLTVPCLYWLCLELFGLPLVGGMAMALLSVSPIQVIYAQEAGSSSLLSLLVVFSGAALLQALRTRTKVAWIAYLAALTLGFYAHYLFIFIVLGYLIYVLSIESFRFTHRSRWFWLTTFLGLLTFVPWLAIVLGYHTDLQIPAEVSQNHLTMLGVIYRSC